MARQYKQPWNLRKVVSRTEFSGATTATGTEARYWEELECGHPLLTDNRRSERRNCIRCFEEGDPRTYEDEEYRRYWGKSKE